MYYLGTWTLGDPELTSLRRDRPKSGDRARKSPEDFGILGCRGLGFRVQGFRV